MDDKREMVNNLLYEQNTFFIDGKIQEPINKDEIIDNVQKQGLAPDRASILISFLVSFFFISIGISAMILTILDAAIFSLRGIGVLIFTCVVMYVFFPFFFHSVRMLRVIRYKDATLRMYYYLLRHGQIRTGRIISIKDINDGYVISYQVGEDVFEYITYEKNRLTVNQDVVIFSAKTMSVIL